MVSRDEFEDMVEIHGENPYDKLDGANYNAIYAWISTIDDIGLLNAAKAVELKAFDGRPGILSAIAERRETLVQEMDDENGGDD